MPNDSLKQILQAYLTAKDSQTEDEYYEAISDINRLAKRSIKAAIFSEIVKIQLERPVVIPLALTAILTSFVLFVKRL